MEPVSILTVIGLITSLTLTLLKEFFSAKARAKERKEKFKMEYKEFLNIVEQHLIKLKQDAKVDSEQSRDLEDTIDDQYRQ